LTKLVIQLLRRIPNSEPDHDSIQMQVKVFKQKGTEILKKLGDTKETKEDKAVVDETSVAKLFEEVKLMFQDLPSRVETRLSEAVDPIRRRRMRRFHPMMAEEILHFSDRSSDPVGLLVILSLLRDELPWVYEIGMETYRAIKAGEQTEIERSMLNLRRAMDFLMRTPIMEELVDSKEAYMMIRELPRMLDTFIHNYLPTARKISRKDKKGEE